MKNSSIFKWLSVMLAVLIVAAAIGCGKGSEQQATPTPVPTATSSPTATAPAEPTGETGTLSDLEGDVQVMRVGAGEWEEADSGMKVGTGWGVKTGSDGYALITFFDGSVMEMEADTEISVEELSKASGGSTTVRIQQTIGNTINRVQNLVDSSSTYEVESPAGSAVVRGTLFGFNVVPQCIRTCVNVIDEEDPLVNHYVEFTGKGVTKNVSEDMSSCANVGGIPGSLFYTDTANDPLVNVGDGGGGGGGSSCPPECWVTQGINGESETYCICQCCCPASCQFEAYEGMFGSCYCPEPTPTYTPPPST